MSRLIYTARDFDAISKNLIKFIELPNKSVLWIKRLMAHIIQIHGRALVQLH